MLAGRHHPKRVAPSPSPTGYSLEEASMSNSDISDAVYTCDIPAERPWSRVLRKGQTLRIIDTEGQQAVDALLYCADDPAERYSSQDTLRVHGSAYIALGPRLVSN